MYGSAFFSGYVQVKVGHLILVELSIQHVFDDDVFYHADQIRLAFRVRGNVPH